MADAAPDARRPPSPVGGGAPAPCRRRNAHTPHRNGQGTCQGTAPEYPWEPVEDAPDE